MGGPDQIVCPALCREWLAGAKDHPRAAAWSTHQEEEEVGGWVGPWPVAWLEMRVAPPWGAPHMALAIALPTYMMPGARLPHEQVQGSLYSLAAALLLAPTLLLLAPLYCCCCRRRCTRPPSEPAPRSRRMPRNTSSVPLASGSAAAAAPVLLTEGGSRASRRRGSWGAPAAPS